jgi:hypothetical protein
MLCFFPYTWSFSVGIRNHTNIIDTSSFVVYNQREMFRRKKKKNQTVNEPQSTPSPSVRASNSDTTPLSLFASYQETKTSSVLTDAFRGAIEKAADRSRNKLISEGKIKPMAFFVHHDSTMKTVSLLVKDEHQKEALIRRISEKALAEDIATVITLTEMDDEHWLVLSWVSPGIRGSARIDYRFDGAAKAVTLWKISWLKHPVQNVFLDSIFDKAS